MPEYDDAEIQAIAGITEALATAENRFDDFKSIGDDEASERIKQYVARRFSDSEFLEELA